MADTNRKIVLARRPEAAVSADCFRLEEEALPALDEGQVLVATEHLSIDAFIRTTLYEESLHPSVPIGGTVGAIGVGRVLESRSEAFSPGDGVFGPLAAQTLAQVPAGMLEKFAGERVPLTAYLGVLGLTTGITAWCGMRIVGDVKPGETVLVSAAAGAVGSVASRIAKLLGARVVGLAGGPEKVRYLEDELGLDAGIDYKGEDVAARLRTLAPEGIDVFFDNVGGDQLDIALDQIRLRGRVVICGAISQYDNMDAVRGPSLYLRLAERQARMEGFAVFHFQDRYDEARSELSGWLQEGKLGLREQVVRGIERFPEAVVTLHSGGHTGKLLVAV